jgi:hypothetical protein
VGFSGAIIFVFTFRWEMSQFMNKRIYCEESFNLKEYNVFSIKKIIS